MLNCMYILQVFAGFSVEGAKILMNTILSEMPEACSVCLCYCYIYTYVRCLKEDNEYPYIYTYINLLLMKTYGSKRSI